MGSLFGGGKPKYQAPPPLPPIMPLPPTPVLPDPKPPATLPDPVNVKSAQKRRINRNKNYKTGRSSTILSDENNTGDL